MGAVFYSHARGGARRFMHTGAAIRLLEIVLGAYVPLRYMATPPDVPERRELLEKDPSGVFRSRQKGWVRRDGGSTVKLPLQIVIILLFDWL